MKKSEISNQVIRFDSSNDALFLSSGYIAVLIAFLIVSIFILYKNSIIMIIGGVLVMIYTWFQANQVTTESLVLIQGTGITVSRTLVSGKTTHEFFHSSRLTNVVINEGFYHCRVVYYLAFIVVDLDRLILPFESIMPRYSQILEAYHDSRSLLFS